MTHHLDDSELSAILASAISDRKINDHLGSCVVCRRRLETFRNTVGEHRRALMEKAPDWEGQKQAILARLDTAAPAIAERRQRRWLRPVLAAAATVICVLGAGLLQQRTDSTLLATPRPDLPIEEILAQTEALLADDTIPGLDMFDSVSEAEIDSLLADQNSRL
jgi:hypothetical protein